MPIIYISHAHSQLKIEGGGILSCEQTCPFSTFPTFTLSSRLKEVVSSDVRKNPHFLHFPLSHSQFKIAGDGILSCQLGFGRFGTFWYFQQMSVGDMLYQLQGMKKNFLYHGGQAFFPRHEAKNLFFSQYGIWFL
jgi:hypothetical protein